MIKPVAVVALVSILAIPAQAQTRGDDVVSQYARFMKSRAAVDWCTKEEGRMQIARNERYAALLHASAKNPGAPTIEEMSKAQAQVRVEDDALSQKRDECMPLFDELAVAVRELRRDCAAYAAPNGDGEPAVMDAQAVDICHGSPSKSGEKASNP